MLRAGLDTGSGDRPAHGTDGVSLSTSNRVSIHAAAAISL